VGLRRCTALASNHICLSRVKTAKARREGAQSSNLHASCHGLPIERASESGCCSPWEFLSTHSHHPQSMACQRCAYDGASAGKQLQLPYDREMTLKISAKNAIRLASASQDTSQISGCAAAHPTSKVAPGHGAVDARTGWLRILLLLRARCIRRRRRCRGHLCIASRRRRGCRITCSIRHRGRPAAASRDGFDVSGAWFPYVQRLWPLCRR